LLILRAVAPGACRDCAQTGFGGPAENRFTAYDAICRGAACRDAGYPQIYVNAANLSLFVRVTDLAFGGGEPTLLLERSYNMDDRSSGAFGTGWSFNLGDTLTPDPDGSLVLHRGSGRIDRFATAAGAAAYFALTNTRDTLAQSADGTYSLRASPGVVWNFRADGKLASIQDGALTRVALEYDAAGHLATARYRGRAITFTSDSKGRITKIADAAGRSVGLEYSDEGRLTRQTNADGGTASYEYDAAGNLASITYAGGKYQIGYTGDATYVSVANVTTPDGAIRQYDVPQTPAEIRVIDGNGDATFYVSSAQGLLQSVKDAAGNLTSFGYDAAGNRTSATNAAAETVTFAYDGTGNLTGITDAGSNRWTADYSVGRISRLTDPKRNAWTFQYDAAGNLVKVTDPSTGAAAATRNASGQVTALIDGSGNQSSYQYSADGLLTGFTDPAGGKWAYDYDGAARAGTRTDPGGGSLRGSYDAQNRLASLVAGDATVAFDYSGVQRNSMGRVTSYTDSLGNRIAYQYDGAGQLIGMTLPGDKKVTYQYDHLRRLSSVSDWAGNLALYRYDTAGYPVSVSVAGGPVTIYQYDSARNLRSIVSTGADGGTVAGYRYTVDANGNRVGVSALEPNTSSAAPSAYKFGYDAAGRPVTRSDGQNYSYDSRGNLNAISGSRTATLGYDPLGRLTSLTAENTTSYNYDSMGLRISNGERRLVWDVSDSRPRPVAQIDSSGAPVAWYVYGLGLLWKVTADGRPYFYHFDGDGNVVAVSNTTAGVVNQYRYDPSGRMVASNEGVENLFHARGESGWIDDGNGLVFAGSEFRFPELRLTLPASASPAPPTPELKPQLKGAGACFLEGVVNCAVGNARSPR
jgi:YD repeat-containing protein